MLPDRPKSAKADQLTGLGFVIGGGVVLAVSLQLGWELPAVQQDGWYTSPGFIPAATAVALMIQGSILTLGARRRMKAEGEALRFDVGAWGRLWEAETVRRGGLMTVLLLVYVFGLIGRMPFGVATFFFLLGCMLLFRATTWWKAAVISALVAAGMVLGFEYAAGIPLP